MSFLKNFIRNPFRQKKFTKNRLRVYGQMTIEILTGKNTAAQYDTLIARLTNSYVKFFATISSEYSDLAIQKAKTQIVDSIMAFFEQKVHLDYMLIGSKYAKGSPEFNTFFPQGLDEYNQISKTKFEVIIKHFIQCLTTYQGGVITAAMLADYQAILANYLSAHSIQSQKKSDVSTDRETGKIARIEFEDDLFFTLLNITSEFVTTPAVIKEYFKVQLLYPPSDHFVEDEDEEEYSVVLAPLETKDSGLTNIVGKTARFINVSEAKVLIYTVANLDHLDPSATAITLDADAEIEILLSELGAPDNPYLILRNMSDEIEAEVVIEWVE